MSGRQPTQRASIELRKPGGSGTCLASAPRRDIIHDVNNFHSDPSTYFERWITPLLSEASRDHPVIVLTGARQVGKSTLLQHAAPFRDWKFVSLDDFDALRQAQENPEGLWAGSEQIVLDEVQKAPALLSAVKRAVDRAPRRYRFVLSGSANLLLLRQVSESLAGRAVYFILDPMTVGETRNTPAPSILQRLLAKDWPDDSVQLGAALDPVRILQRGLMPPLLTLDSEVAWTRWWQGYVSTYLERDLRQIAQIDNLVDFRRVMELTALRTGQLLNQSEVGRDAKLSQSTVHRYLNILEATHLFERLPSFASSHSTRLLKSPKAFWADPGLAVFLSGYYSSGELKGAREYGGFFESLIYHHLRVLARHLTPAARLFFWRTQTGAEVDFVLEHGRRVLAFEIKSTDNPGYRDTEGMRRFLEAQPEAVGGVLLHGGNAIRRLDTNIIALPWSFVAESQPSG